MTYLEPGTSGDVNLHITQKNDNQSTADESRGKNMQKGSFS